MTYAWQPISRWERWRECASDECRTPAFWMFESGDIRSYYCNRCKVKIEAQALTQIDNMTVGLVRVPPVEGE